MQKKIPFFSIDRQTKDIRQKIRESVDKIIETKSFVGGKITQIFEENFSEYLKINHTISCNSGTDALWLALKAIEVQKNDIVLTTPFSFIASSSEIVAHNAHPVFIDVEQETFNIDANKIVKWLMGNCSVKNGQTIHKQTGYNVSGIITVDIFGQCSDYKKITQIAKKFNLWIIEDACQAVGAKKDGKMSGTFGDIGCFSFYPTKNLGAFGDAGCCVTNNPKLAEKIRKLRNHGRASHYKYEFLGKNSRLDGIQATILIEKLKLLNKYTSRRQAIAKIYHEKLKNIKNIILPKEIIGEHVYHQYSILATDQNGAIFRERLQNELSKHGIETRIFYPETLQKIDFLNTDKRLKTKCPIANNITNSILALPIWPELTDKEVLYICDVFKNSCTNRYSTVQFQKLKRKASTT